MFQDLFSQIAKATWVPLTRAIWRVLEFEGWPAELEDIDQHHYMYTRLDIPRDDVEALKVMNDRTVNAYNAFDIELKRRYGVQMIDLIDYDKGTVTIVWHQIADE